MTPAVIRYRVGSISEIAFEWRLCMIGQMLADEGRDEVVTVIIALLHPPIQREGSRLTGILQILGIELIGAKFIRCAD